MITLPNIVQTTTRQYFFPTVVDNWYAGNQLFERFFKGARPWPGGRQIVKSTTISARTSGGSYSGFDAFTTTQEDVRQLFTADPCQYYWNLTLNGIQLAVNKGPEAYIDLIAAEFEDVGKAIRDKMGSDFYLDGTGNSSKAINGLNYHIDDSTDVSTYQGLARGTYTTLKATRNAQSGAIGLANLAADYNACQIGTDVPSLILTTPAVFNLLEALFTFSYQVNYNEAYKPMGAPTGYNEGLQVYAGVNNIKYRGIPIIADEKCTSGNIWMLNEKHLWLYTLDHNSEMVEGTKEGFAWTGWKRSQNQDAIVGQLLFAGQLFGDSPRTMSRRTAVTT